MSKFVRTALALSAALCALQSSAQAQDENGTISENHVAIGAGILFQNTPFTESRTQSLPLPLISIKQGVYYFEGAETGIHIDTAMGDFVPSIDLFVAARGTSGKDREELTADVGVRASIESSFGSLSGEVRHDITGKFDGTEIIARYSLPISAGHFSFTPALQASWLDRKTANYMYGVTAAQRAKMINKNRDVILPVAPITKSALNLGGDIAVNVQLSDNLMLLGILSGTYLDRSIHKSPAISQKWESQAIVGVAYKF